MKKYLSLSLIVLCSALNLNHANADWDPENCLFEVENFSIIQNSDFKSHKSKLLKALEGGWCSAEKANLLIDFVALKKPQICVEIGACTGFSVLPIAATLKFVKSGKIYAVDAWSNEVAVRNLDPQDPNKAWWSTVDMKEIRRLFKEKITTWGLGKYVVELACSSDVAAHKIQEPIDFLHLDGDYSEEGAFRDVEIYLPKVKEGGYILLSNLFIMINGKQPKFKAFCLLFEQCDMVCEIEKDNAILFKKR